MRSRLGLHFRQRGQSAVELAFTLPVLVVLLLVVADFGRLFYVKVALNNAARAGAQYGSQSVVTAADTAGMSAAATSDGSNISGMSVTAATECTCITPSNVTVCPSGYCTNNPQASYVEVDTQAVFKTVAHYPGIPSTITLPGKAIMQVQQ